jgi:hypothetical protein
MRGGVNYELGITNEKETCASSSDGSGAVRTNKKRLSRTSINDLFPINLLKAVRTNKK